MPLRFAGPASTSWWPHTIVRNEGDVVLMYMPKGSEITRARTASGGRRRTSHSLPVWTKRRFDLTDNALDVIVTLDGKVLRIVAAEFQRLGDAGA